MTTHGYIRGFIIMKIYSFKLIVVFSLYSGFLRQ